MVFEHEEEQYLELIRNIIEKGTKKDNRTGIPTYSITGAMLRFSLKDYTLPLLTTKKVNIKAVVAELIFFIKGQTDNSILTSQGINIWTPNSTKEFMAKNNINREEGDLGPVYGFQWRHYGAAYVTCKDDYTNKGIDQLKIVIDEIKNNKNSRRLIVVSWNPLQLEQMVLPPCHTVFQFIVRDNFLDCCLFQRSGDIGLGIPFNIASYSLLVMIVSHICGLEPGEFIHFIGDAHIYENHIDALKVQLQRKPMKFPKVSFKREIKDIDDISFDDIEILNYISHGIIKMNMAT